MRGWLDAAPLPSVILIKKKTKKTPPIKNAWNQVSGKKKKRIKNNQSFQMHFYFS